MPTDRTYGLSPLARLDLEEIWTYTRKRWSRRQADTYVRDIISAFAELAAGKVVGISAEDIRPGYRKHLIGAHFIFYRPSPGGITVIRVLHGSMDIPAKLNP